MWIESYCVIFLHKLLQQINQPRSRPTPVADAVVMVAAAEVVANAMIRAVALLKYLLRQLLS